MFEFEEQDYFDDGGGDGGSASDIDYKKKLENLLSDNGISHFRLSHNDIINGDAVSSKIEGKIINGKLDQFSVNVKREASAPLGSELPVFRFAGPPSLTIKRTNSAFVESVVLPLFKYRNLYNSQTQLDDNQLYKDIYNAISGQLRNAEEEKLQRQFKQFGDKINKQLANPFYKDVDIAVNVQVRNKDGRVIHGGDLTYKTNNKKKNNDINIQIFLNADGSYSIKHKFSETYLKEFEQKWIEEAKKRGLDVDIPEMREDIIAYLNSQEAELSFGKKFLQSVKKWYDNSVAGYIEGIQATQKITKNIWKEGVVNESTWYSKDKEYKEWPEYVQFNPVVGGAVDGVIDEIVGIPMACKSVYELVTEDEKRKALGKIFTAEGFKQMLEGLKESAVELKDDSEKRGHFGGQTAVSVITMMSGAGFIGKLGKTDELMGVCEKTSKIVDGIPDAKFMEVSDLIKKSKRTVDEEKLMRKLVAEMGEDALREASDELFDLYQYALKNGKKYFSWEDVQAFFKRGNDFNRKVRDLRPPKYQFHEVTVEHPTLKYPPGHKDAGKPVRYRVDSYSQGTDIVSRKATDFNKIQLATFEKYCLELKQKYPVGAKIVKPNTDIDGQNLSGNLKIEVPKHNELSSRVSEFEAIAQKHGIELVFELE